MAHELSTESHTGSFSAVVGGAHFRADLDFSEISEPTSFAHLRLEDLDQGEHFRN